MDNLNSIICMDSSSNNCSLIAILKSFVKKIFQWYNTLLTCDWRSGGRVVRLFSAYSNIGFLSCIEGPFFKKTQVKIKCIDIILNTVCSFGKLITNAFVSVVSGFLSLQFSRSVMSDSLWPHGPQHSRLPSPSPTLGAYSNLSIKVVNHPTISSSVIPFSSHLKSFPASGSFQMSQFFASGGQNIGASASALVLQKNIQDRFP